MCKRRIFIIFDESICFRFYFNNLSVTLWQKYNYGYFKICFGASYFLFTYNSKCPEQSGYD